MTALDSLTDEQLAGELAWARFQRKLGGTLGFRTDVAERIKALECETLRRCWDAA